MSFISIGNLEFRRSFLNAKSMPLDDMGQFAARRWMPVLIIFCWVAICPVYTLVLIPHEPKFTHHCEESRAFRQLLQILDTPDLGLSAAIYDLAADYPLACFDTGNFGSISLPSGPSQSHDRSQ